MIINIYQDTQIVIELTVESIEFVTKFWTKVFILLLLD